MANFGTFDYSEFTDFVNSLDDKAQQAEIDKIMKSAMTKAVRMVLAATKESTPVSRVKGKPGGTLRRGWATEPISHSGKTWKSEIFNTVHYAPHVEYGHRTRGGGFVAGRYMMTDTVNRVQSKYEQILEQEIEKYLNNLFG